MAGIGLGVDGPGGGRGSLLRADVVARLPQHMRPPQARPRPAGLDSPASAGGGGSLLSPSVLARNQSRAVGRGPGFTSAATTSIAVPATYAVPVPPPRAIIVKTPEGRGALLLPSGRTQLIRTNADVLQNLLTKGNPLVVARGDGSFAMVIKGVEGPETVQHNSLPPALRHSRGMFYTDVNIHSDQFGFAFKSGPDPADWVSLSGSELADVVRTLGWQGEPVRLLACSAGGAEMGAAHELAGSLGVDVLAPTTTHWRRPGGRPNFVGELAIAQIGSDGTSSQVSWRPGAWRTFAPPAASQPMPAIVNPPGLDVPSTRVVPTGDMAEAQNNFFAQLHPDPSRVEAG